jgi:YidC/Oxa1 family membrane protein insertase
MFSNSFGYALGFLFETFGNYGVAIIVFTVLANLLMFPAMIKRQKSMTPGARYETKKEELKKKFGNNTQKFSQELMKLNQRENINPVQGCLSVSFIFTIVLFSGIYGVMQRPLSAVLRLPAEKVKLASELLKEPGAKNVATELQIVNRFDSVKDELNIFSPEETEKISKFASGFNFLGINLLKIPKEAKFSEMVWILPLICLFSSLASAYVMRKTSGNENEIKGMGLVMNYALSLFPLWIVYTVSGAVGLYLVTNSLINLFQILLIDRYFSIYVDNARIESKLFKKLISSEVLSSEAQQELPL